MATNWKALLLASMIATTAFGARNVIAAPAVSAEQTTFKDIDAMSNDTQAAIREAVSLGLIAGYPDGAFKPNEPLTRTQLAVLLVKALHLPVSANAGSSYKDVAAGSWSAGYIEAVRKAGLMNGTDAGFDPNRNVTRQELASVFVRAVNGLNTTGGRDADPALADGASGWAAASVQAALRLGLMTAKENGFAPREEVARADIAQLLVDIFPEKRANRNRHED
ncbi:S-layer homology domain-containing protein [Cohnella ginsengisoli]|uniref:S-layer homology domain-containing protein n=1 Tax=Cohnella ginsengisoli TaxID=425004 RepID=A0A9X4KN48_9BACL|nr:S-layer homology domain-containing protein [Cohnella ginsengisoli]MDG0794966.1 S-layer homology domain-containing protein [Cohnella ginsengisoli]